MVRGATAVPAGADDHQMIVGGEPIARLLERREGGDAGAGIGRGEPLRHALMRQEVAAVRHDDVRGIAAGATRAQGAGVETKQLLALLAYRAFAAADPRIGHDLVADLDPRGARPE